MSRLPTLLFLLLLSPLLVDRPHPALAVAPAIAVRGEVFADHEGQPLFLLGANYEGPADRAWRMWEADAFDPDLIAADLARAREANLSVLRLFVQRPLADDIQAGRWDKLDRVLDLADEHDLRLILTLADYGERDLADLVALDAAIAERYRGRATILAFDLKNEPRFYDLAITRYPEGQVIGLQDPATVAEVGERIPREKIAEYRASPEGQPEVPSLLNDDEAYLYANLLAAYLAFLDEAQTWAREHESTIVQYLLSPDSAHWDGLKGALNQTLAAWLEPRLSAIRAADPARLITVGHRDPMLASLPVNAWLDYRTLHLYPSASSEGIARGMKLFDDIRAAVPEKPLVLGEFGFSNAALDEQTTAALEVELVRAVREHGGDGALKWMLNDVPNGFDPRENAFGMYRADGSPKPIVDGFRELGTLQPLAPEPSAAE